MSTSVAIENGKGNGKFNEGVLHQLRGDNRLVAAIFAGWCTTRERARQDTNVRGIRDMLMKMGYAATFPEVTAAVLDMKRVGIVAVNGQRVTVLVPMLQLIAALGGRPKTPVQQVLAAVQANAGTGTHTIPLGAGRLAGLSLPSDVTRDEIAFLKTVLDRLAPKT